MMITEPLQKRIFKATEWIASSNYLVIFTGAGISTESGIPDYRGPDGVWTRRDKGLAPPAMKKSWDSIQPNSGHYVIVELQNMGKMKYLISQNVDNLHLASGIRPDLIAEFHGNHKLMKCQNCKKKYSKDGFWDEKKWGKGYLTSPVMLGQPKCPSCKGRIISSVVNFNDPIPEEELRLSIYHSQKSDLFIVVGSSLSVQPAAGMPHKAKINGARLIIINKMKTPMDSQADLHFSEGAGQVLTGIAKNIKDSIK